jgi:hypothetical protein
MIWRTTLDFLLSAFRKFLQLNSHFNSDVLDVFNGSQLFKDIETLLYYPGICLEKQQKITTNLIEIPVPGSSL